MPTTRNALRAAIGLELDHPAYFERVMKGVRLAHGDDVALGEKRARVAAARGAKAVDGRLPGGDHGNVQRRPRRLLRARDGCGCVLTARTPSVAPTRAMTDGNSVPSPRPETRLGGCTKTSDVQRSGEPLHHRGAKAVHHDVDAHRRRHGHRERGQRD